MIRKRLVRVHLKDDLPSIEGLVRTFVTDMNGGHYVVELARVLERADATVTLEGSRVRIPRERVAFIQELK